MVMKFFKMFKTFFFILIHFFKIVKTVKFLCLQFDNSTFITKYDGTKYQSFSIGIFSNKSSTISLSFLRCKESNEK